MPKKNSSWGVNQKAVEAREKKAEKKRNEQETKQKAQEDAYWRDDNKQDQRKKDRKEAEQRKKQDALARKQEAKKLLEEEEAKLGSAKPTKASTPAKKVTRADIEKKKEIEQKQLEEMAALNEKEKKRITENPTMEEENPNRKMAEMLNAEGGAEARNVEDAISVLSIGNDSKVDIHLEKRIKAAYTEFEQREMPRIKAENPGLRLSQLKQILRKEFQKSPDNPYNKR